MYVVEINEREHCRKKLGVKELGPDQRDIVIKQQAQDRREDRTARLFPAVLRTESMGVGRWWMMGQNRTEAGSATDMHPVESWVRHYRMNGCVISVLREHVMEDISQPHFLRGHYTFCGKKQYQTNITVPSRVFLLEFIQIDWWDRCAWALPTGDKW